MFKKILNFILGPYKRYKENKEWEKRMKELRDRDPFIYK